jgi:hypothetical protein
MIDALKQIRGLALEVRNYYLRVVEQKLRSSLQKDGATQTDLAFMLGTSLSRLSAALTSLGTKSALAKVKSKPDWPDALKVELGNCRQRLSSALDRISARLKKEFAVAVDSGEVDPEDWTREARARRQGVWLDAPSPPAERSDLTRSLRLESRSEAWVEFCAAQEQMNALVNRAVHLSRHYAQPPAGCEGPEKSSARSSRADEAPESFVPTEFQQKILTLLDGKALRSEPLAKACGCEKSRLYKPSGALKELRSHRRIDLHRRLGYFRPDAPPQELRGKLTIDQKVTN